MTDARGKPAGDMTDDKCVSRRDMQHVLCVKKSDVVYKQQ